LNSDKLLDFYLLVRIFVLYYGALVVVYEIEDISNLNFDLFDVLKLAIGILMIVSALTPRLAQIIFRKNKTTN
jgi:hypothetical protein|tara:strand:- start:464 stop:682 length:219 start_codon:yes stop_codon:yes gene_type:complete